MKTKTIRGFLSAILIAAALGFSVGCNSLTTYEKQTLTELRGYGKEPPSGTPTMPAVAGVLNILPGFGNFYLAIAGHESGQAGYGLLNLLFWPWSVVWGIPEAVIDSININEKEFIAFYTYNPVGRQELENLRAELKLSTQPRRP